MSDKEIIKHGSLFDGIGGFPFSASKYGINPVWASEIELWPIKVTQNHFPNMKHLGDITKINGADIEPVDIITFGSPCQDLSVAGKRAGLEGQRSGLFMDAIRIIREMRSSTGGKYPRFAVWENVPGAFSSNNGQDFRAVLEEITEAEIPMPVSGHYNKYKEWCIEWAEAGMVRTESIDVAWRTLDAQYWGVPQRRKRIFLVADFGGQCAGEILFVEEGLRGHFAESRKAREEVAATIGDGIEKSIAIDVYNFTETGNIAACFNANSGCSPTHSGPMLMQAIGFDNQTGQSEGIEVSPSVRSESHGSLPCVASPKTTNKVCGCLSCGAHPGGLNGQDAYNHLSGKITGALDTCRPQAQCIAYPDPVNTLLAKSNLSHRGDTDNVVMTHYAVRRLTPLECLRLQGYPDWWLDIEGMSDSAKYKAVGNSVAIPCVDFVMSGISRVLWKGALK